MMSESIAERRPSAATSTFVDLLHARAQSNPHGRAYTFLADGEQSERHFTYSELDAVVRGLAACLQSRGFAGSRAVLAYPPGPEFVVAFLACLYAGVIAVPVPAPRSSRHARRFQAVTADAGAAMVLTSARLRERVDAAAPGLASAAGIPLIATDALDDSTAASWARPDLDSRSLAFLQYTSGSVAEPKGVMITHGNLLENEAMIQRAFATHGDSVIAGWLPFFHDMGLIGNILHPLYVGATSILMSPMAFLQRPFRWLDAISRFRATVSGGPNFAYEHCLHRISDDERAQLDLRSWAVAFNGAEPVRASTMDQFAARFAMCGFRREAFRPCYGLAEATLLVSGQPAAELPRVARIESKAAAEFRAIDAAAATGSVREVVSCGRPLSSAQITVLRPGTVDPCGADEIGEICVSGPHLAAGYWKRPADTATTFVTIAGDGEQRRILRTGDLGFVRDGELFISGRLKDTIIIRGTNHHPEDIEWTARQTHAALSLVDNAAFAAGGTDAERLVIVQEVDDTWVQGADIVSAVRDAILDAHEIEPSAIVLVKPRSVPKTSSGKVRRGACRQAWLDGTLDTVLEWHAPERAEDNERPGASAPAAATVDGVIAAIGTFLASRRKLAARFDADAPLSAYGVDSLIAIELSHHFEREFNVMVAVDDLVVRRTPRDLAAQVVSLAALRPAALRGEAGAAPPRDYPLTYGQQALWTLWRTAPDSSAYNLAAAVTVGGMDVAAMRSALERLVARHPALRTSFEAVDGRVRQRVHDGVGGWFAHEDASGWSEEQLRAELSQRSERPFDLQSPPLFRAHVLTRDGAQILLVVLHHIVADGWSMAVLMRDLVALYAVARHGASASLEPPRGSYADFVSWQANMLAGSEGERQRAYWERQLAGDRPGAELSSDRRRPAIQTFRGATAVRTLSPASTAAIQSFAAAHDVTLYSTLLASLQTVLAQYTGEPDVAIGTPVAARPFAGLEDVVGYFANPVVMRCQVKDDATLAEMTVATHETSRGALANQHYPFARLVEVLQVPRDPARSPLFDVLFTLHQAPGTVDGLAALMMNQDGARFQVGETSFTSIAVTRTSAQFDLSIAAAVLDGRLHLSAQYNSDLFDAATIERLLAHYETVLSTQALQPASLVRDVPLVSPAETRQILEQWNDTAVSDGNGDPVHVLFEQQAARTPNAPAVRFWGHTVSYRELNQRANRLARHLRAKGAGADVPVGVFLERSVEMVVALMATLKAGAAFVPLEPEYPKARLMTMIAGARVPLIITQDKFLASLPDCRAAIVSLDGDAAALARESGADPGVDVHPQQLAYVLYTSGSTGLPKGAMNTHAGLANRIQWMQQAFGLGPRDRVLQKTPFSFDVSVWEFFWPLMAGAELVVARPDGHRDAAYLVSTINEAQITTVHFVPSMLQPFVDAAGVGGCPTLQRIICSGEALTLALQQKCLATLDAGLHNLYGPTEASIDVTAWECSAFSDAPSVPIGRPIANTQIYLLDRHRALTPPGVAGELFIGGANVGRGYIHAAARTAEKFVPDPFGATPGARLYRTGDLARWRRDGSIEFIGRKDAQIKLRGQRIELGEIEAVLAEHPAVRAAAVVVRDGEAGAQLIAYVEPVAGAAVSERELRTALAITLPAHMVPAQLVLLAQLPLTRSGKIDRQALPAPPAARPDLESVFEASRNPLESVLEIVWAQALGVAQLGVHDNFFELGGHSLLAARIAERVQAWYPTDVPILTLIFQNPTIAGLAEAIELNSPSPDQLAQTPELLAWLRAAPPEELAMLT